MLTELLLRPFNVSVTEDVGFETSRNEGPFHFAEEALFLKAEKKWSMLYYVKANQNFVKNKSKTKKLPLTWYINCG